ncbi:MAG: hypothetical protein HRU30_20460, partial [Rhodobacteraceae bacterium]|nr:hypothetical protein [Paracoccaceae bacterium]
GSDLDQGLARPLCGPIAADDITQIVEHVVGTYLARRRGTETFLQFVRSLTDDDLPTLLPQDCRAAA